MFMVLFSYLGPWSTLVTSIAYSIISGHPSRLETTYSEMKPLTALSKL
jgi:hypothetical protein